MGRKKGTLPIILGPTFARVFAVYKCKLKAGSILTKRSGRKKEKIVKLWREIRVEITRNKMCPRDGILHGH